MQCSRETIPEKNKCPFRPNAKRGEVRVGTDCKCVDTGRDTDRDAAAVATQARSSIEVTCNVDNGAV
jgi:hypothetical protein